jgi:serine/threonine protein kinase
VAEETFGPYQLECLLGRGGMGEVWRANDTHHGNRPVAIKLLGSWLGGDEDFARRFRRECELAAKVASPHVIPIHRYGELDGRLFIEMPLIDGVDLGTLLANRGPLSLAQAAGIIEQVADALDTAHAAGLVHRDVKPSNILVTRRGFAYLIDFGIARAVDGTAISLSGAVIGTPAYMAPERFDGTCDNRSDIYALGCVLYEVLTGRQPYEAPSLPAYMKAHISDPQPRPSDIRAALSTGLDHVVARALAKDPAARYPTATALAAALRACGTPQPLPPVDTSAAGRSTPRSRRGRLVWGAATLGLCLVLLLVYGLWSFERGRAALDGGDAVAAAGVQVLGAPGDNAGRAFRVIDGDPTSSWHTYTYRQQLPALTPGIGLLFSFDKPVEFTSVSIDSPSNGTRLEIRYVSDVSSALDNSVVVAATIITEQHTTIRIPPGLPPYSDVLVWINHLGENDYGFGTQLDEVQFHGQVSEG